MMQPLLEVSAVTIVTAADRVLFANLNVQLARERVALIGRNGVGKSTLLAALAGLVDPTRGTIRVRGSLELVPQLLATVPAQRTASHGELRRRALETALAAAPDILLLDEPTEDLDQEGVAWLRRALASFGGCLVVASHDRRLLTDFEHFFVVSETGCRHESGSLAKMEDGLEREHEAHERRYARALADLAEREAHTLHVARRKARKKRYGRCSELDRGTPRIRLNQKRSDAQVSHGRLAKQREAKLEAARDWSKSMRRALSVKLDVELPVPKLDADDRCSRLVVSGVSARVANRGLFGPLDLRIGRERIAIVGPNGAGKTTLLEIMLGQRVPATGSVARDRARLGVIEQGGANWMLDVSLAGWLETHANGLTPEEAARILVTHRFPLALAHRPLASLSPGERARAALICLWQRAPTVDVLLLDEPTFSLDLVGQRAITKALRAWPGGLIVASHDESFLVGIGIDDTIVLRPQENASEPSTSAALDRTRWLEA